MDLVLNNNSPTICLNMIVKNESKIITRLFDSVLPIIDCYCICDTGSTDNTVTIITEYFKNKGVPGKVVIEPFKNFCHNRNFALQSCLNMADYVLLMDADMVLEINNFNKKILRNIDYFYILQGSDDFYYQNVRIVKNDGLYSYSGVTHEYINTPANSCSFNLEKNVLFIRDHGDGGSKHDKFERDIRLLTEGIREEPDNGRYYFYLANSYHDSGHFEKAIGFYLKRIQIGGWKEEVWYSYYRIGTCYKHLNKFSDALFYWMEGYNFYPERLEGVYEIIKHYRIESKHKLANMFYEISKKILDKNISRSGYLFLHDDVYRSRIYYEYTIIAAYVGVKNINDEVILFLNHSNNDSEINNLFQNMKFYNDILQQTSKITLDNKITQMINNENTELTSSSSCLIPNKNKDGYLINIRYVNYFINSQGSYLNCDRYIITGNKYIECDKQFNILSEKMLEIDFDNRRYIGVEDVRIFHNSDNDLRFIGTGYHKNETIGIVTGNYDIDSGKLNVVELKQTFNNSGCEKNWVFVDYNDSTHVVYDWSPLKICKINSENKLDIVETKKMPSIFSRVRGSTCGFKYSKSLGSNNNNETISMNITEDEIWFVNHLVSYESPRHYYHIISVFDKSMNLLRYSALFKFEGESIEYCLSILVEDERVLVNYSTWDRTTRIGVYDKKYIDSIVKYN